MQTVYSCFWNSDRGFGNEGQYIYGSAEDCKTFADKLDDDAGFILVSNHRTLDAAKARAEKELRAARRNCLEYETLDCLGKCRPASASAWAEECERNPWI